MTNRILIAGCGDIGTAVGQAFVADGHYVCGLRRRPVMDNSCGIDYFQADLTDDRTLKGLNTDFDLVLVIVTPSERNEQGYQAVYLDGVANLLNYFASQQAEIPVMYVSSTRVYGQHKGEWVDESSDTVPADAMGRVLLKAEQQVLAQSTENTVIRFSGIYGRGANYLARLAQQGQAIQHSPSYFTNRVHRDDCVAALKFIADKRLAGESLERLYLVTDNEPAGKWEVVDWMARQLNVTAPEKLQLENSAEQGKRCSNQRIRAAGFEFTYTTYRQGYVF